MRNRFRLWLISLANKIGDGSCYDFGEPIVQTLVWKDILVACTKNSIYSYNGDKWVKIKVGKRKTSKKENV